MYVKPGVYIEERQTAGGVLPGGFIVPCIIGVGLPRRRAWDELVERGRVIETITPAGATGIATLSFNSNQRRSTSRLFRNDVELPEAAFSFSAANQVQVAAAFLEVGAVWRFSYLAENSFIDSLANTPSEVIYVSKSLGGAQRFRLAEDFQITTGRIDWTVLQPAVADGTVAGPFNLGATNRLSLAVDGRAPIAITITGVNMAAVTPAEVVSSINTAASTAWGTAFASIASVHSVNRVRVSSVTVGKGGSVNFHVPATGDATNLVFGFRPPSFFMGRGERPALGTMYYVRYDFARPAADFDRVQLFHQYTDALAALGPMVRENHLLIGTELAFLNGARTVGVIQVRDIDADGLFVHTDWTRAIAAVRANRTVTDVVLLNTMADIQTALVNTIDDQASLLNNHWMAGWFGVPTGMSIGDPDTVGTIVHRAAVSLQVGATSPGRGRFILVVPAGGTYTIVNTDTAAESTLTLDSSFLAAAVAGMQANLNPISESLLRRQVIGFVPGSITLSEAEASFLASRGVFAVVNVGGRLICFDPVTTDRLGEELFREINVRPQKDFLANRIRQRLDGYAIGVVPDDLDQFLYELRSQIGIEIESAIAEKVIAPYRDAVGRTRNIDIMQDIKVYRSQVRRTEYRFAYWFQAKWTIKRIFGEYLVDTALL